MTLRALGDLAFFLWAPPAILAPLVYLFVRDPETGKRFGFRRSPIGIHMMAFMGAFAYLAVLGFARLVFGETSWWAAMRAVGYLAIVAVTWWRLAVVWRAYRDSRRELAEREKTPESPPGTAPGP